MRITAADGPQLAQVDYSNCRHERLWRHGRAFREGRAKQRVACAFCGRRWYADPSDLSYPRYSPEIANAVRVEIGKRLVAGERIYSVMRQVGATYRMVRRVRDLVESARG